MNFIYAHVQSRFIKNRIGWTLPFKALWLSMMVFVCSSGNMFGNTTLPSTNDLKLEKKELLTVSGVVKDAKGEALIGVNVFVEGSDDGTATGTDGSYSINVPDGSNVLVFSYTGYKTMKETVNGRTTIDVLMAENTEITDEIVVIGYGTVKKSDLTGSVSSLNGKDLTSLAVGNPTSALQGKMTGV